jgi:prefoldin alpha subunit
LSNAEDRINNLVSEIRMLEGGLNEISSRQNFLERILVDARTSIETIKGLGSTTAEDVLIPVGAGVLLRSVPPKVDKVLVNIGANVVVEKGREEATKFMEGRVKDLEESLVALVSQRNQVAQRLDSDRRAAQTLINGQGQ